MKNNKCIRALLLVLLLAYSCQLFGGNKALFIHGFGSSVSSWIEKGTPEELLDATAIDDTVFFGYKFQNIEEGLTPQQQFDIILANLHSTVQDHNSDGDKWIIIGHSLGGLLARIAEPTLLANGINIVSILTIGSPHQGAPAVNVTTNNAQGILNEWHAQAVDGPDYGISGATMLYMGYVAIIFPPLAALLADEIFTLVQLPTYLEAMKVEAEEWINLATISGGEQSLAPYSEFILGLNSVETTANYRSIIGAERSPTIVRFGSEVSDFFEGATEYQSVAAYDGIISWYGANVSGYETAENWAELWCFFHDTWAEFGTCDQIESAIEGQMRWENGQVAWQNIDDTWSQAIACGQVYSYNDVQIWHPGFWDCTVAPPPNPNDVRDGAFNFEVLFDVPPYDPDDCVWIGGHWEIHTVAVYSSEKNDGLIQPNMALWKPSDTWTPEDLDNMRGQENYYYSDTEQNGGWNHSEMMRYTRIYDETSVDDLGEAETPLKRNEGWIELQFINTP